MIKKLRFWWFMYRHDYPCKQEVLELWNRTSIKSTRILSMAAHYCVSGDINQVATKFGVTRERVRQCLLKLRRETINEDKTRHLFIN